MRNAFVDVLRKNGMAIAGICPDGGYVEIVEIEDHPWFVACQFHPEFKSRPLDPHPLFRDFVGAAHRHKQDRDG